MEKGLRFSWVVGVCVLLLATCAPGQGQDSGTWHGGSGNWSNASQWDCGGPDFINAHSPVCTSPPNGTQFGIALSGGTINVDINVSVQAIAGGANATLVLNGTSLTVASGSPIATLASAQLSNGAVINPGLGMVTLDLAMQNSTVNGLVSVSGLSTPTGTVNISGSSVQQLVLAGSGTLTNSTLGDNSVLEISGKPSSVSNTSFNGSVGVDLGGSLTLDNTSMISSVLSGTPQDVSIGASVSGSLTMQGGSQLGINGAKLNLGILMGASGTVSLNDTSSLAADNEIIGGAGSGQFTQSGGTNTVNVQLTLGDQAGGTGTYNLNGGQLSAVNEIVGSGGTGTFEQIAGTNAVSGTLTLGNLMAGDGVYELKGTGTLTAGNEIVGGAGTGVFNQVLGSQTFNSMLGTLTIGAQKNGNGTYILDSAGNDVVAANEVVGDAGTGLFTQGSVGGSDNKIIGTLTLGKSAGGTGTYNMLGGTLEAQTEIIGAAGSGTFNQKNGINTVTGDLGIGSTNQGSGTYNLSGGGTLKAGTETLGNDPCLTFSCPVPGTINQTGGTNLVASGVLGGVLTLTSGSTYSLSGGKLLAGNIVDNGKLDLSGTGSLQTASITVGSNGLMTVSGSSVSLNVGVSTTNNGVIIENGIGPGTNIKWGAFTGNARFTIDPATNDFTDLTMLANGSIQAVAAGSQFDVSGNFVNLSTQNTLWDTGGALLDFTGGGAHSFGLAGQNGAGFSDNFAWGTLAIDPGNTLNLDTGSGDAQYVNFLQGLDISGNTITNIDGTPGLFLYYNAADNPLLHGDYSLTNGGELIAANGPAATPEPSTLLLFGSGLGSLVARRRWRSNKGS